VSSLEPGERKRLVAAAVTTIAALPLLLAGAGSGPSRVATIGQQANISSALGASGSDATPAAASPAEQLGGSPGFLIGPPPATDPSEVAIAVPTSRVGNSIEGKATYQHLVSEQGDGGHPCAFAGVAPRTPVTIMDLDNGKSIACTVFGPPNPGVPVPVVLGVADFASIADLGQSPINVRVSW